jgi:hypothetical protein
MSATAHVLQNPDLMRIVLLNNVGAATAIATGCVCRVWREAAADQEVVRAAALYTGGLTKSMFMRFFALSASEMGRYEYKLCFPTNPRGFKFHSYRDPAVEMAIPGRVERRRKQRGLAAPRGTFFLEEQVNEERLHTQQLLDKCFDHERERSFARLRELRDDADAYAQELVAAAGREGALREKYRAAEEAYTRVRAERTARERGCRQRWSKNGSPCRVDISK